MGILEEEEREKGREEIFETMIKNLPKLMSDTQSQFQNSESVKLDECPKLHLSILFSNYRKSKIKNSGRNQRGKNPYL